MVVIAATEATATFDWGTVLDDTKFENIETVVVTIATYPTGYTNVTPGGVAVAIKDDDAAGRGPARGLRAAMRPSWSARRPAWAARHRAASRPWRATSTVCCV
jgi:hypothetical protein